MSLGHLVVQKVRKCLKTSRNQLEGATSGQMGDKMDIANKSQEWISHPREKINTILSQWASSSL